MFVRLDQARRGQLSAGFGEVTSERHDLMRVLLEKCLCVICCWRPAVYNMSVIDHVRDMAAAGLHSNVRLLSSLLLTMSNNNP